MEARKARLNTIKRIVLVILGAIIVSIALEAFLVPNKIIDGGIVGISIILSTLTSISLGVFLVLLNIPFFILGYKQIGKTFAFLTLLGIVVMAIGTTLLHHIQPFTTDPLLAAAFGGALIGVGVGLVIRYGGTTDGIEVLSVLINKKTPFSVGEVVMFFNFFIFLCAGPVFGWNHAMYSIMAYFIAVKMIDITIEGLEESKSIWIISDMHKEIGEAIQARLGRPITYLNGKGGFDGSAKEVIFCVITRLEEAKLKLIVDEIDENAFLAVGSMADVRGGQFKKKDIH